jgi:hypothetical protein
MIAFSRRARAGAAAVSLVAMASIAHAQAPAGTPVMVRGTVEKLDGATLVVKTREGNDASIKLADPYSVRGVVKISLADVKPGSRVGITSMPQADGSAPKAVEIHIFPEDVRPPEIQTPYDLVPKSTMTNATVNQTVAGNDGHTLTVKYKDGEMKVQVAPDTPIATYVPGTRDELKPGAKVVIRALKAPDGTLSSNNVSVGRNGFMPPM